MTYTGTLTRLATGVLTRSRLIAMALVLTFTAVVMQPAQAQTSDTWKSVAIIGGATAAGAYIGHRVAGNTGAYVGAGVGASVGYAIDRRRRQNEAYNQGYYDPNAGYYPSNPNSGGYYPDPNAGYYPNGGPYDNGGYPYGSGNNFSGNSSRQRASRRAR